MSPKICAFDFLEVVAGAAAGGAEKPIHGFCHLSWIVPIIRGHHVQPPDRTGFVAIGLEQLHHGHAVPLEIPENTLPGRLSNPPGITAGHQRRAARTANGAVVELCKTHSVRRQTINRRRLDLAAIAAQIREPHVIRHHDDDVRPVEITFCPTLGAAVCGRSEKNKQREQQ